MSDEVRLIYAAAARCRCGEGLAYPTNTTVRGEWWCSRVLRHEVKVRDATADEAKKGAPGGWAEGLAGAVVDESGQVHDVLPFWCYEVKSECQPSADGRTTRPGGPAFVNVFIRHEGGEKAIRTYLERGVRDVALEAALALGHASAQTSRYHGPDVWKLDLELYRDYGVYLVGSLRDANVRDGDILTLVVKGRPIPENNDTCACWAVAPKEEM